MLLTNSFLTIKYVMIFACIFLILVIFLIAKAIKKHFSYKKQLLETQQQILTELKKKEG